MGTKPQKPFEQIIDELDLYPIDAFDFLREGLKHTVEKIHGEPTHLERQVQEWMAHRDITLEKLTGLYETDELPDPIAKAVRKMGGPGALNRHIDGHDLCVGLRDVAIRRWGLLASTVLARWNIRNTADFGRIVFALVENDYLQKQPHDTMDDFKDVFDFKQTFEQSYTFEISDP